MAISLHYLNSSELAEGTVSNRQQNKVHSVSGPLSINWALGDMASVNASANIVGFVDSNRPDPGYVTLSIKNTSAGVLSINLSGLDVSLATEVPVSIPMGQRIILFGICISES
jgi:hypothetical protein